MNIATFLKTQADIVSRFESGFSGYRGLAGENMDLDENILTMNFLRSNMPEAIRNCGKDTSSPQRKREGPAKKELRPILDNSIIK